MEERLKLAIDLDGTLADFHTPLCEMISRDYNTTFVVEDIDRYDWGQKAIDIGLGKEGCIKLANSFWAKYWDQIPFTEPYVPEVLAKLVQDGHIVDIVTANTNPNEVSSWLRLKEIVQGTHFHELVFDKEKHTRKEYKVFYDDFPMLFGKLNENQYQFMFDRPWNRKTETNHRLRLLKSIRELPEHLATIK